MRGGSWYRVQDAQHATIYLEESRVRVLARRGNRPAEADLGLGHHIAHLGLGLDACTEHRATFRLNQLSEEQGEDAINPSRTYIIQSIKSLSSQLKSTP